VVASLQGEVTQAGAYVLNGSFPDFVLTGAIPIMRSFMVLRRLECLYPIQMSSSRLTTVALWQA
jgi:hypothetical protein